MRHHPLEIVRRPRLRPGLVRCRTVRARPRDVVRRHLDGLFIITLRRADDAGVVAVVRQAFAVRDQRLDQSAHGGRNEPLVRQLRKHRHLPAARVGAAGRHVVLLRHNFRCLPCREIGPTQQGHLDSVATRATINLRRIVAMEFGTWRSGRNGGPSGPISFGNCNFREQPGGTSS